ncbi:MAG: hypothetical protein HEP71_04145 [Roseivirga sp.]|nr:hypothetical protein [Roseivirga sp.]
MSKLNFKNQMFLRAMLLSLIVFVAACSGEEPFESMQIDQQASDMGHLGLPDPGTGPGAGGYLLTHLVPTGTCFNLHNGAQGTAYGVRVTGNKTQGYDRIVHVAIIDDGILYDQAGNPIPLGDYPTPPSDTIVETVIVTIPAGQTQSQLVSVFGSATRKYKKVKVKILSVFDSWASGAQDIQGNFELRHTEPTAHNCYISTSTGPGIDPCGIGGDEDGDGICDYVGFDDN